MDAAPACALMVNLATEVCACSSESGDPFIMESTELLDLVTVLNAQVLPLTQPWVYSSAELSAVFRAPHRFSKRA